MPEFCSQLKMAILTLRIVDNVEIIIDIANRILRKTGIGSLNIKLESRNHEIPFDEKKMYIHA